MKAAKPLPVNSSSLKFKPAIELEVQLCRALRAVIASYCFEFIVQMPPLRRILRQSTIFHTMKYNVLQYDPIMNIKMIHCSSYKPQISNIWSHCAILYNAIQWQQCCGFVVGVSIVQFILYTLYIAPLCYKSNHTCYQSDYIMIVTLLYCEICISTVLLYQFMCMYCLV